MVVPASLNFNRYRVLQSIIEYYILTYFHVASRTVLKIRAHFRAKILGTNLGTNVVSTASIMNHGGSHID